MPVTGPIFLPLQPQEDNPDFSGQPTTSIRTGVGETIAHDLAFGPTAESIEFLHDKIFPGKVMTPQQYDDSEWKRPGVSFPNGVSQARAKRSATRHDAEVMYQDEMSGMNNGVLGKVGKFAGNLVGFSLDPVNIAAIGAAVASGGAVSEPLLASAAEYGALASVGARFGVGALEAAAATAPSGAISYGAGKFYGEDPSLLHAVGALALNAALGGLIHTAIGAKGIIDKASHAKALITATDQLESGKSAHVDELVKNGAYQAGMVDRINNFDKTPDELGQEQVVQRAAMLDDLKERQKKLAGVEGNEDLKQNVQDQIDVLSRDKPLPTDVNEPIPRPVSLEPPKITPTQYLTGDYDLKQLAGINDENSHFLKQTWMRLNDNQSTALNNQLQYAPVDADGVKVSASKVMGYQGESSYNQQVEKQFNRQVEGDKDLNDIDELTNGVNAIKEELPQDLQDTFDDVDDIQKQHDTVGDEVQNYADCINGNNFQIPR